MLWCNKMRQFILVFSCLFVGSSNVMNERAEFAIDFLVSSLTWDLRISGGFIMKIGANIFKDHSQRFPLCEWVEWAVAETSHLWRLSFCSFPCYSPAFECVRVCICACVCVCSGFWWRAKFALSLANEACPIPTRAGNWLENQISPCGGARFGSFPLGPRANSLRTFAFVGLEKSRRMRFIGGELDFICIEIDSGHRNPLRRTGRKLALFETSKNRASFLS